MTTVGDRSIESDRSFVLSQGTQTVVQLPSMQSPLSALPDEAFENLLVISIANSPSEIEAAIQRRGGDPSKAGVIPVSGSQRRYDGPLWTAKTVSPSDLTGISIEFSTAMEHVKPDEGWVVLDSINMLLMYAPEDRVHRFVNSIVSSVRKRNVRGVYSIVQQTVTDETYDRFKGLFDEEVRFDE